MFEKKHQPIAPRKVFIKRIFIHIGFALMFIALALFLGVAGYHWIAGLNWVDALYEASMILGGMGPYNPLKSESAKIFASMYALFSGLVFIALIGIVMAPVIHRILHRFYAD